MMHFITNREISIKLIQNFKINSLTKYYLSMKLTARKITMNMMKKVQVIKDLKKTHSSLIKIKR